MKKAMLIYVSSTGNGKGGNTGNNNKFYYIELKESGDVYFRYGRVGTSGSDGTKQGVGLAGFHKLMKSKTSKGYVEVPLDLDADVSSIDTNTSGSDIMMIALSQIKSDDDSKALIKKLVARNIHNITSNTKITFNASTGLFKTPLGVVTKEGIDKAESILDELSKILARPTLDSSYITYEVDIRNYSEQYYCIIPTTVDNLRSIYSHIYNKDALSKQYDICSALRQSIDILDKDKLKAIQAAQADTSIPVLFNTSLVKLTDSKEFDRIERYFEKSKNSQHGRTTSKAKIKNIYCINIKSDDDAYRHDLTNQMELWHGTKVVNILSILKSGLLMPKYSPGSVTGYMFGQGLYFSNQSSKSLNYCDGMYWNNSNRSDNFIYMFVANIAMGNYQVPKGSTSKLPDNGYDSYWAQPGKSGIMNDEMIVFKNEQIQLKYLLEIEV